VSDEQRIPLSPLSVLIGRNGSGKSTVIEALQWIDTTLRRDANAACDPYRGMRDLINKKAVLEKPVGLPYFEIDLDWSAQDADMSAEGSAERLPPIEYRVAVGAMPRGAMIVGEYLFQGERFSIESELRTKYRVEPGAPAGQRVRPGGLLSGRQIAVTADRVVPFLTVDRLALSLAPAVADEMWPDGPLVTVRRFFRNAVFLRLSPKSLSQPSRVTRSSDEPILDEEGARLPALLRELSDEQLEDVVEQLKQVLPDVRGMGVNDAGESDLPIHYHIREALSASDQRPLQAVLPAWMLSEGTRRLTALFALLARDPSPSLLCIEEIENGLDPWTVVTVLHALRSAVARGVQVILTTHSPWLLDHVRLDEIIRVRRVAGETRYERFADDAEVQAFREGVPPGLRYVRGG
jgi:predicted ATPase